MSCEEQVRVGRNAIEKRHFKFIYQSPLQEKELPKMYVNQTLDNKKYKGLSSIKKQKLEAYGYLVEAVHLMEE